MIKLGTLSDKLNHTADCKESIRQAVNQSLGGGAELISPSTQFDQYADIIQSNVNQGKNILVRPMRPASGYVGEEKVRFFIIMKIMK